MTRLDYELITLLAVTFFLAGLITGIAGLGLPTISLGILSLVLDLETAMALLLVPSFTTNLWQAFSGGSIGILLRRRWPFLLPATVTVWLGAALFAQIQPHWLSCLCFYCCSCHCRLDWFDLPCEMRMNGPLACFAGW